MDRGLLKTHKRMNALQSIVLIGVMALLTAVIGWRVAGPAGPLAALTAIALSMLLNPSLSPGLVLRLFDARPLADPGLREMVAGLARRAGLPAEPQLFYVPSRTLNAFTLGSPDRAVVAVTDGLLRQLAPRELHAVLAHEISHIRNNDAWVMGLAELFSRMTAVFCLAGQLLLLVNMPLILFSDVHIDWLTIALLLFSPGISVLVQLALSRVREYDADLEGAALCGDPLALAGALQKIERAQAGLFERLFWPGRELPERSILHTHPPTAERIRRLQELVEHPARMPRFP